MHIGQYDVNLKGEVLTLVPDDSKSQSENDSVIRIDDKQGLIDLANAIYDSFGISYGTDELSIHRTVTSLLSQLSIPTNVTGYHYLREAIRIVIESPEYMTKTTYSLYPKIAEKFQTESSRVERNIRHAIEVSWQNSSKESLIEVFGYYPTIYKTKPTNTAFMALVSDKIRLDLGMEDV